MTILVNIESHRSRVDAAFDRVRTLPQGHLRLYSDFTAYLTVLVYGYLEQSVQQLLMDYVRYNSAPAVSRYTNRRLERSRSMKYNNLVALLGSFDPQWRIDFENMIDERSRSAIDTVTNNRHQIAHGRWTGITIVAIKREYEQIKNAINMLIVLLDSTSS